jgi:hypothetical protein
VRKAAAARHLQAGRLGAALAELAAAGDAEGAAAALAPLVADVAAALTESPQPGAFLTSSQDANANLIVLVTDTLHRALG